MLILLYTKIIDESAQQVGIKDETKILFEGISHYFTTHR